MVFLDPCQLGEELYILISPENVPPQLLSNTNLMVFCLHEQNVPQR